MNPAIEEQLAAYLDGAMDEAEAHAFEARLAADPDLAARAKRWQANDSRIAAVLVPLAEESIDADLLADMGLAQPAAPKAMPLPVPANDNARWWRRRALPLGGALAASIAVLMLAPRAGQSPQPDLSFALETGTSLKTIALADGTRITPTLTVRAADGRYCREFRSAAAIGLACREGGRWRIKAEGEGGGPSDSTTIATASGADAAALDAAYRKLGASDPLDAKAEATLIARGWQE